MSGGGEAANDGSHHAIDEAMAEWRQGDLIRPHEGGPILAFQFDPDRPLTDPAKSAGLHEDGGPVEFAEVDPEAGFVVVSQTCDIVRECAKRPFVKIAPVEVATNADYRPIAKGYQPQRAAVPGFAPERLVANLDLVMAVEKGVLAKVASRDRVHGRGSEEDQSRFAAMLARKFERFAFPDDFVRAMSPVAKHIRQKHSKQSDLGRMLEEMREIRLQAIPDWNTPESIVMLLIFPERQPDWNKVETVMEPVVKKFDPTGRYQILEFEAHGLETMTAAAYLSSDPLDLDHLSMPSA